MGAGKDLWNQFEAAFNAEDRSGLASLFTRDAVYIGPSLHHEGRDAIGAFFGQSGKAFADINYKASLVIEDGDTVVAEATYRATHIGPLLLPDGTEVPATGNTLEFAAVTVCRLRDGKFATMHDYFDSADMTRQLGLRPAT